MFSIYPLYSSDCNNGTTSNLKKTFSVYINKNRLKCFKLWKHYFQIRLSHLKKMNFMF